MSFEVVRDVDGLSDREINDLLLVDDTPDHRTSVSRTKSVISGLGGTSMNSANSSLGDDAKWRFQGVSQRRAWKMRIRIASHPVPLATRALASLLAVTVAISWVVTSGLFAADDPPRFDRGKTKEAVRAILAKHVGQVRTGLWMGGQLGVDDPPGGLPLVLPRVEEDGSLDPAVAPSIQGGRCCLEETGPVLGGARLPAHETLRLPRAIRLGTMARKESAPNPRGRRES